MRKISDCNDVEKSIIFTLIEGIDEHMSTFLETTNDDAYYDGFISGLTTITSMNRVDFIIQSAQYLKTIRDVVRSKPSPEEKNEIKTTIINTLSELKSDTVLSDNDIDSILKNVLIFINYEPEYSVDELSNRKKIHAINHFFNIHHLPSVCAFSQDSVSSDYSKYITPPYDYRHDLNLTNLLKLRDLCPMDFLDGSILLNSGKDTDEFGDYHSELKHIIKSIKPDTSHISNVIELIVKSLEESLNRCT